MRGILAALPFGDGDMPRGGRRVGAGRKPRLTYFEKLAIGAQCERLWREVCQRAEKDAIDQATFRAREQWAKAAAVPRGERQAFIESRYFQDDYLDDVRFALKEDQGIEPVDDDREPDRVVTIRPARPKGHRTRIISKIAGERGASERMVERCWKEFRAVQRRIDNETDTGPL